MLHMRHRSLRLYMVISLVAAVLYLLLPLAGFRWFESLELVTLNFRFALRGPVAHSDQVVVVGIDDRSLSELYYREQNPWPWRRGVYARLLDKLGQAGAKSVGMDVSFDTQNPHDLEGDRLLAESFFAHPFVSVGTYLINNRDEFAELAPGHRERLGGNQDYLRFRYRLANPDQYAAPVFFSPYKIVPPETLFMNSVGAYGPYEIGLPEEDGMFHEIPLVVNEQFLSDREQGSLVLLPTLDVLALYAYFGLQPGDAVLDLKQRRLLLGDHRRVPIDERGYFMINYYGRKPFREVPVIEVLDGSEDELARLFKDKIVLIGYTAKAKGLFDLRPTPFNKNEAGVQLHATVIQNILDENYLTRAPHSLAIMLALLLLFSVLLSQRQLRTSIAWALAYIVAFNITVFLLFQRAIWVDAFYPNLVMLGLLLANTIYRVYLENREKLQIKNYFAKYVPAQVVEEILNDPDRVKLGGEEMEITVLFSDVVGFTSISEQLEPEELVRLLNEYLTEMTAIIKDRFHGTLDKYVGDAIVAIFGAPLARQDDPVRAVGAALAMRERAVELQRVWQQRGEKAVFDCGVGINTGRAVVGNIGSPDRLNYTCIGDTVNTAARLETATRTAGAPVLISEATHERIKDQFACVELPPLAMKGKSKPATVFSVVAARTDES